MMLIHHSHTFCLYRPTVKFIFLLNTRYLQALLQNLNTLCTCKCLCCFQVHGKVFRHTSHYQTSIYVQGFRMVNLFDVTTKQW